MDNNPSRVARGSSCFNLPSDARVALRVQLAPGGRNYDLGVRLVRVVNPLQRVGEVNVEDTY